jgi:hypothetical protein
MSAQTSEAPRLSAALWYASLGWSVVPVHKVVVATDGGTVCSCPAGASCGSKGKHPAVAWARYQRVAATPDQIRVWFEGPYASYGVGIVTGAVSGFVVVDVDEGPGKAGGETLNDLQFLNGDLPFTVMARTGGGGRHIFLLHPRDIWVTTGRNVLGPGVDVRGDGGFIVAAPSMHESGRIYLWDETAHPRVTPIAPAPPWLLEMAEALPPEAGGGTGGRALPTGTGEIVRDAWGKVIDGRERFMVGIVCGVIASMAREAGALPAPEAVVAEAWPTYERAARPRGASLDADGRGIALLRQRVGHFLRRARDGKWNLDKSRETREAPPFVDPAVSKPETPTPAILTAAEFMAGFVPPDYIVDGVIQRGRLYSLTSPTGHGKTAIALYIGCMVATGRNIGALEVVRGHVVFLAGENPDDLRCRLYAACQVYGLKPAELAMHVLPATFPMTAERVALMVQQINALGCSPALIIVDTAAAFFPGDDDNQNVQMGDYARTLRILTTCDGAPAVVTPAHPVKNPDKDNLLPRGGGAFLNEVDGNLTLWAQIMGETASLHWQGKIRGADFAPVHFALQQVRVNGLADSRGRPILSIVAVLQTDEQADAASRSTLSEENTVLEWLRRHPGITQKNIALNSGWVSLAGVPNQAKVFRLLRGLQHEKLVIHRRRKWVITEAGKAELEAKKPGSSE